MTVFVLTLLLLFTYFYFISKLFSVKGNHEAAKNYHEANIKIFSAVENISILFLLKNKNLVFLLNLKMNLNNSIFQSFKISQGFIKNECKFNTHVAVLFLHMLLHFFQSFVKFLKCLVKIVYIPFTHVSFNNHSCLDYHSRL